MPAISEEVTLLGKQPALSACVEPSGSTHAQCHSVRLGKGVDPSSRWNTGTANRYSILTYKKKT